MDKLDLSSITIHYAEATADTPHIQPFFWGPSPTKSGFGDIKVRLMLTENLTDPKDYYQTPDLTDPTGIGEDRNYFMTVDTFWSGTTYVYSGYVEVEYDLTKPDLVPVSITTPATIQINTPVDFDFFL